MWRSNPVPALALLLLSAVARADEPLSIGTVFEIRSEVLKEDRTILVSLPRGYESGSRYPVLYVTDGESQFLHTAGTAEFLARVGRIAPLIVVGVTNGRGTRTRDLTPTRASGIGGGADAFLSFLETELIPRIDKTYRTAPFRVFAGHSFGGLFAIHALATRPALFGGVIAASPSLDWDDELPIREMKALLTSGRPLSSTLYVTLGSEGPVLKRSLERLRDVLKKEKAKGLAWEVRELLDDDHGSVVLKTHYDGLQKVFEGWRLPRDPATGSFAGGLAGVKAHYAALSRRLGYTILPPEGAVNGIGYTDLAAKRLDRALEAFRLNVESYPDSPNVHDSLGEGLEAKGDLGAARDSYARAVELAKRSSDPLLATFQQHLAAVESKPRR